LYNTTKLNRALTRGALVSEGTSVADNSNECFPGADYFTCSSLSTALVNSCFFCSKSEDKGCGKLHQVTTLELDARVRHCANILNDCTLIANLSAGDMIALEAKYHAVCLVSLYKKCTAFERNELSVGDADESAKYSLAFAQLVQYICEVKCDTAMAAAFKLSELARKYTARLEQMGAVTDSRVHTTRLKNRLLSQFPEMRAQTCGKEVLLVCDKDIGVALSTACQHDTDIDALHLVKAAQVVCRDMFSCSFSFSSTFSQNSQEQSVPQSLKSLIQMILQGSSIDDCQDDTSCLPATLTALLCTVLYLEHLSIAVCKHICVCSCSCRRKARQSRTCWWCLLVLFIFCGKHSLKTESCSKN